MFLLVSLVSRGRIGQFIVYYATLLKTEYFFDIMHYIHFYRFGQLHDVAIKCNDGSISMARVFYSKNETISNASELAEFDWIISPAYANSSDKISEKAHLDQLNSFFDSKEYIYGFTSFQLSLKNLKQFRWPWSNYFFVIIIDNYNNSITINSRRCYVNVCCYKFLEREVDTWCKDTNRYNIIIYNKYYWWLF